MSDRYFLDTNVLVYAFDAGDLRKAEIALRLIRDAKLQRDGVISYQVVQEFFNVAFRKFPLPPSLERAQQYLSAVLQPLLGVQFSAALCSDALGVRERHKLSWYDSLIVAAAQQAQCAVLYTEDLQHGQRFGDVLVTNPFLS